MAMQAPERRNAPGQSGGYRYSAKVFRPRRPHPASFLNNAFGAQQTATNSNLALGDARFGEQSADASGSLRAVRRSQTAFSRLIPIALLINSKQARLTYTKVIVNSVTRQPLSSP
jgi:hypothetical protein